MSKFLYAGGCSMTWGSEMVHPNDFHVMNNPILNDVRNRSAWPGVLSRMLNLSGFVNDGVPGQSNDGIARRTLTWIKKEWIDSGNNPEDLFVVINWTHILRWEFFDASNMVKLSTIHFGREAPSHYTDEFQKFWTYLNKESAETYMYHWKQLTATISQTQAFLRNHKIPYAMAYGVGPSPAKIMTKHYNITDEEQFHNYIKKPSRFIQHWRFHGLWDKESSFSEILWKNGKKKQIPDSVAPGGHPYADGHHLWAKYLYNWINEFDLTNQEQL